MTPGTAVGTLQSLGIPGLVPAKGHDPWLGFASRL